jgi:hypothetical protein
MRKASTELLEQGIQAPSPAPDLIPAKPKNQPRNHIAIGTANGGTSQSFNFSFDFLQQTFSIHGVDFATALNS